MSDNDQVVTRGRPRKPQPTEEQSKAAPQIKWRGQQQFRHDLFKAECADMLKNASYQKGKPMIQKMEHSHFFHSFNSQGKAQTKTNTIGGHYHEVTWKICPETNEPIAECGPPIREVLKRRGGGLKKYYEQVEFNDELNDRVIKDDHRHKMTYLGSEIIDPQTRRADARMMDMVNNEAALASKAAELGMEL